jgi:hypothetical protein
VRELRFAQSVPHLGGFAEAKNPGTVPCAFQMLIRPMPFFRRLTLNAMGIIAHKLSILNLFVNSKRGFVDLIEELGLLLDRILIHPPPRYDRIRTSYVNIKVLYTLKDVLSTANGKSVR